MSTNKFKLRYNNTQKRITLLKREYETKLLKLTKKSEILKDKLEIPINKIITLNKSDKDIVFNLYNKDCIDFINHLIDCKKNDKDIEFSLRKCFVFKIPKTTLYSLLYESLEDITITEILNNKNTNLYRNYMYAILRRFKITNLKFVLNTFIINEKTLTYIISQIYNKVDIGLKISVICKCLKYDEIVCKKPIQSFNGAKIEVNNINISIID